MTSLEAVLSYFETNVRPFIDALPAGDASYWHLQYTGCASVEITNSDLRAGLLRQYPGVFSKGFTAEEIPSDLGAHAADARIFLPCLRDASKLQVNAVDDEGARSCADVVGAADLQDQVVNLQNAHLLTVDELEAWMVEAMPWCSRLFALWTSTPLQNLRLTSVGIAIAHANYRRLTGDNPPLSIWVSEDVPPT